MARTLFLKKLFSLLFITTILTPQLVFAQAFSSVTISAQVNAIGGPGGGGGGGGGGGPVLPTIVNFSGTAYPFSRVYVLKDGNIAVVTIADPGADFSVSLGNLSSGIYTFSVYGEDSRGRKSSFFSFPIFITLGAVVNIGNIFISPTIEIDKAEVKKGDSLIIFGQSAPKSEITISVNSFPEYFFKVASSSSGSYLYNLDTSILEFGKHQTKSKSAYSGQLSPFAPTLSFLVSNVNKKSSELKDCSTLRGDLNCDGYVNLIDFSIMAYWYKKLNPPTRVDLSEDGKITLVDFSILVFHWTG